MVPRVAHDFENLQPPARGRFAYETHPCNVVVDSVWRVLFGPNVKKNAVAFANRSRSLGTWFVVGIAAVAVNRDYGSILRYELLAPKGFQEPLLNLMFVGASIAYAMANFLECRRGDSVYCVARGKVRRDLCFRPGSFEQGD